MSPEIDEQIWATIRELEPKADAGDADAQHHLFVLLNSEAMSRYDMALFEKAEAYLFASAKNGFPEAVEQLKTHDVRRGAFERRVKRWTT